MVEAIKFLKTENLISVKKNEFYQNAARGSKKESPRGGTTAQGGG